MVVFITFSLMPLLRRLPRAARFLLLNGHMVRHSPPDKGFSLLFFTAIPVFMLLAAGRFPRVYPGSFPLGGDRGDLPICERADLLFMGACFIIKT